MVTMQIWREEVKDFTLVVFHIEVFFIICFLLMHHASIYRKFRFRGSEEMSKSIKCYVHNQRKKHLRQITQPPWKEIYKWNRMKWTMEYINTNFFIANFTDEYRRTLVEPKRRSKVWVTESIIKSRNFNKMKVTWCFRVGL